MTTARTQRVRHWRWATGSAVLLLMALLALVSAASPAHAAGFNVNSTIDEVDAAIGDGTCSSTPSGVCTLRAAIQEANASLGVPDTISLPAGVYTLTRPGADEDASATGDLDITHNSGGVYIYGSSLNSVIIDGGGLDRVLEICCQTNFAYVEGVTIRNGRLNPSRLGFYNHGHGAGIHNHGDLVLKNVALIANTVDNSGSANTWGGGGLTNGCGRTTEPGTASCSLHALGDATLTNVTISGNAVVGGGKGGGIENGGILSLTNVTISNNSAPLGGGISNNASVGGFVSLVNLIVANSTGGDCTGTFNSLGHNIAGDSTCAFSGSGDRNATNPRLGPLLANGGSSATHALWTGSPAIDAGDSGRCPSNDQRSIARPQDGNGNGVATCDIGAYELAPVNLSISYISDSSDPVPASSSMIYMIDVYNPGPTTAADLKLTDTLPAGIGYINAYENRGGSCAQADGTVTCRLDSLDGNRVWTVYIMVRPIIAGLLNNTPSISASNPDPNPVNNSASESTQVLAPQGVAFLPLLNR